LPREFPRSRRAWLSCKAVDIRASELHPAPNREIKWAEKRHMPATEMNIAAAIGNAGFAKGRRYIVEAALRNQSGLDYAREAVP